jgi:hypothetical protein
MFARLSGRQLDDERMVRRRLRRALKHTTGPDDPEAAHVQPVGIAMSPDEFRRWRKDQLRRLPGAFVPELERGREPLVLFAVPPRALRGFLRGRPAGELVTPPVVGMFEPPLDALVALAGTLAGWLETHAPQRFALAPPLLRTGGRTRVCDLGLAWQLPPGEPLEPRGQAYSSTR